MSAPESIPPTTSETVRLAPSKRSMKLGVALGLVVLASTAIGGAAWSAKTEPASQARAPLTNAAIVERLERIHDAFPFPANEQRCTRDFGSENVPLLDFDALHAFRQKVAPPSSAIDLSSVSLSAALEPIGAHEHVGVLKTVDVALPRASLGSPESGRYEGLLVVFDLRSATPICQARVVAWSSRYVLEPGISERIVRDDFVDRLRTATREASQRISPNLSLDL